MMKNDNVNLYITYDPSIEGINIFVMFVPRKGEEIHLETYQHFDDEQAYDYKFKVMNVSYIIVDEDSSYVHLESKLLSKKACGYTKEEKAKYRSIDSLEECFNNIDLIKKF